MRSRWLWLLLGLALWGGGGVVTLLPSRGVRNNNPGNLERGPDQWLGLAPAEDQTDARYWRFIAPEYGLRAMARVLRNYAERYGLNTVGAIVARYAPRHENPTAAYIASVSDALDLRLPSAAEPNGEPFDVVARLPELMLAMIRVELGRAFDAFYSPDVLRKALAMERVSTLAAAESIRLRSAYA